MYKMKFNNNNVVMDNVIGEPISLEKDKEYECEVQVQGNNVIVNGQPIEDPNATYWVIVNGTQIPYSKECFERAWSIV